VGRSKEAKFKQLKVNRSWVSSIDVVYKHAQMRNKRTTTMVFEKTAGKKKNKQKQEDSFQVI
jgi:hypothetical protein